MKYQIGEVAKMLDMSVEKIRFYEKKNIVNPLRKKDSPYREYDIGDIFFLMECILFRDMGFSVNEISDMLHTDNLEHFLNKLCQREQQLYQEVNKKQMVLDYVKQYRNRIEYMVLNENNYWFSIRPEHKYIKFTDYSGTDHTGIDYQNSLFTRWLKGLLFSYAALHLPESDLVADLQNDTPSHTYMSIIMESRYVSALDIPIDDSVKTLPEQLCINTVIRIGERENLSARHLKNALEYIVQRGYTVCGETIATIVVHCTEGKQFFRILDVSIPVTALDNQRQIIGLKKSE